SDSTGCGTSQLWSLRLTYRLPGLHDDTLTDTNVVGRPIRIFGSTQDDYNPIAACEAYVERLRAAGADVEVTEHPNASHAFDNPLGAQPAMLQPRFQSARNCKVQEEAEGLLTNTEAKQPFTYTGACVAQGVHRAARPASRSRPWPSWSTS